VKRPVALDFPGSGFLNKPLDRFSNIVQGGARLLDYFLKGVVNVSDFISLAHQRELVLVSCF